MSFKVYKANLEVEEKVLNFVDKRGDFKDGDFVIAVMDRGWVFVGFLFKIDNEKVKIECAYNIHRWGTSKGLGEIAANGPTSDTVLYSASTITGKPIFLLEADLSKWP